MTAVLGTLTLSKFLLKRLSRRRGPVLSLIALPLVLALARALFTSSSAVLAWSSPLICGALTFAVVYVQRCADRLSGLDDAYLSCPPSGLPVTAARVTTALLILACQLAVLMVVRF